MRTAIKLVLIAFVTAQIIAPFLAMIPCVFYLLATTGGLDKEALMQILIVPAQWLDIVLMGLYLWKAGYVSKQQVTWSPVSSSYLVVCVIAILSAGWLISVLMDHIDWLPDILKSTFDVLRSGWWGILIIVVGGPILEEVLFRGAITRALLRQFSPKVAILISASLFGIIHFNPAQVLPAFLLGILLAWVYYKTASLIPCILMHIVNNALSVYMTFRFPQAEAMSDIVGEGAWYLIFTGIAFLLVVFSFYYLRRVTIPYPWKGEENIES